VTSPLCGIQSLSETVKQFAQIGETSGAASQHYDRDVERGDVLLVSQWYRQ
jgi:hypothetical protein